MELAQSTIYWGLSLLACCGHKHLAIYLRGSTGQNLAFIYCLLQVREHAKFLLLNPKAFYARNLTEVAQPVPYYARYYKMKSIHYRQVVQTHSIPVRLK